MGGRIALAHLHLQPAEVAVHVSGAGDEPEVVGRHACDGHVGGDATVLLQQLGIDDRTRGAVDQVAGHAFQQRQGASARDLDLAERAHVDDAHALAKRQVLRRPQVEIWRTLEPERALGPAPTSAPAPGATASRWQTISTIAASWTKGKRRAAPARSGSKRA